MKNKILKNLPLLITIALFIVLFVYGAIAYDFTLKTFFNRLNSNAYLIVVTVGITFVLISGGIDISVGSAVAFASMFSAWMLREGLPPAVVIAIVLLVGAGFGAFMGSLIQYFKIQPFIATLSGLFLLRGMCAVISVDAIAIRDPFYRSMALNKLTIANANLYYYVLLALFVIVAAWYVMRYTRFGRNIYAIGGSEQSALLMGLPVAKTKVSVYAVSGFCAALGGVIFSVNTLAGQALQNVGMELDAISSAVIGGVQLTGGVGTPVGSLFGVLIQGIIQEIVIYENLNTWWTKIVNAALLCIFIVMQRMIAIRAASRK